MSEAVQEQNNAEYIDPEQLRIHELASAIAEDNHLTDYDNLSVKGMEEVVEETVRAAREADINPLDAVAELGDIVPSFGGFGRAARRMRLLRDKAESVRRREQHRDDEATLSRARIVRGLGHLATN